LRIEDFSGRDELNLKEERELMERETESTGSDLTNLTSQIQEGIQEGKYTWREIQDAVVTKTREAAETTDQYVHENPWKVVGIAAAFGFVLGLLMAPRSDE
jgi:ElaB/YqjD/DUF883 family membrane-anchored ribosome-binding protein